jgi:hypothetical protein
LGGREGGIMLGTFKEVMEKGWGSDQLGIIYIYIYNFNLYFKSVNFLFEIINLMI